MKQPTKDTLRDQLVLAADEIISLRQRLSVFCDPDSPYMLKTLRHRGGWEVHNNDEIGVPLTMDYMEIDGEVVVGDRKPWFRRLWAKCKAACEGDSHG